jgi:hypothetical protein
MTWYNHNKELGFGTTEVQKCRNSPAKMKALFMESETVLL